jgi:hypothetical protein
VKMLVTTIIVIDLERRTNKNERMD